MSYLDLGVISTFPPRKDGIAAFTHDLLGAVTCSHPNINACVAAITDAESYYPYPQYVRWEIEQGNSNSYSIVGRALSQARLSLVLLQHEFGLYGVWDNLADPLQDHTAALLDTINAPLITTLHTVLPQPRADVRDVIRRLSQQSAAIIVMADAGVKILTDDYDIEPARIVTIPFGVPAVRRLNIDYAKRILQLQEHTTICTFGLLGRNKGIETVIQALPKIVSCHPDLLYLVVGETHPQVYKREGESYRHELVTLARALGVSRHVRFVNRYLDQQHLIRFLQATDVYVTPYHDHDQITSGTLSYALACGRAIVSTPYVYAMEVLAEDRGLLADVHSATSIGDCISMYLDDPSFRHNYEERAWSYGRAMAWTHVGDRYAQLFQQIASG